MYFTREPVIESVLSARDGYKLQLKNSKHSVEEEHILVDAVEIVSIGQHCFYRNSDRSKMFLLPSTDYEIIEVRDAKMNLKLASIDKEKGIKIAGGRDASLASKNKKSVIEPVVLVEDTQALSNDSDSIKPHSNTVSSKDSKQEKWKEKKRQKSLQKSKMKSKEEPKTQDDVFNGEAQAIKIPESKSFCLLPPPSLLIADSVRNKSDIAAAMHKVVEHRVDDIIEDIGLDVEMFSSVKNATLELVDNIIDMVGVDSPVATFNFVNETEDK